MSTDAMITMPASALADLLNKKRKFEAGGNEFSDQAINELLNDRDMKYKNIRKKLKLDEPGDKIPNWAECYSSINELAVFPNTSIKKAINKHIICGERLDENVPFKSADSIPWGKNHEGKGIWKKYFSGDYMFMVEKVINYVYRNPQN